MHFGRDGMPPAGGYWALTLYDGNGGEVENRLDRFALSSRMPLAYNADGSVDLYVRNADPGPAKVANWLPAPTGGFDVMLRLYGPEGQALAGDWTPPSLTRDAVVPVSVQ